MTDPGDGDSGCVQSRAIELHAGLIGRIGGVARDT
jgi:hypothetical protein